VAIKQALERAERVARHAAEAAAQVRPNSAALLERDVLVRQADAAALPWPDGSIDLFVTSPVYPLDEIRYVGAPRYRDYASYLQQVDRWAAAMFRAAAPQGRACINVPLDTRADGVPRAVYADWLAALLRAGWSYQTTIVWHEGNVSRLSAWGSYLSASVSRVK
jgi:DNA modification methylase